MQGAINEIEDKIEIVVLLMEKCNTNYEIKNAEGILSLVDSIVDKGFIGVDFKENNVCQRIDGDKKLLLIDTDKSMHLKISEDQKQISKQYMILLFISELYQTWLWYRNNRQIENKQAQRFYTILEIMVKSYVTSYNPNEKDHFIKLLTGIDVILSPIPGRTPIEILIYYMPVLTGTEKYDNILNAIKAQTLVRNDKEKYNGSSVNVDNKDVIDAARINMTGMFHDLNNLFTKPQKKGGRTKRKLHKNSKPRRNTKTKR